MFAKRRAMYDIRGGFAVGARHRRDSIDRYVYWWHRYLFSSCMRFSPDLSVPPSVTENTLKLLVVSALLESRYPIRV